VGHLDSALDALLGAFVLFIVRRGWVYWQCRRPGRKLWSVNESKKLTIVITSGSQYDGDEYTETVYPTEARAASETEHFVHTLYPKMKIRVKTSNCITADDLRGNLCVIGGPVHNRITRQLLDQLEGDVQWRFNAYDFILDGETYNAKMSKEDSNLISRDIGVVYRGTNPYAHDSLLFLFAGCRTFGPLTAARAMIRREATRNRLPVNGSFSAVYKGDVHGDDVLEVALLAVSEANPKVQLEVGNRQLPRLGGTGR